MRGFKVEGIILKRRDLGEADRILTVFTYQKGKISILAKGVRRIISRRAGNVELLNRVLMYLHQAKTFLILTEASSLDTFPKLKEDLTLSTYAFHIIELVDKLTAENQENRILYEHLVDVLRRLSKKPRQILVRAFETKILSLMGFVNFQDVASNPDTSLSARSLLTNLELLSWDKIEELQINEKEALELERVLEYHIEKILEAPLKSKRVFKQFNN